MGAAAPGGGKAERFVALDGLRGVCACMVALYHLRTEGWIANTPVVLNAFLFVDFFFVLSGFVIASSYGDRLASGSSIKQFMLLRLGRVYPLHLVVLAAFVAFEIAFALGVLGSADRQPFSGDYDLPKLFQSALLLQIFLGPDGTPWNGPSWSIAAEVWTYLIFALLFRFAGRAMMIVGIAIALAMAAAIPFLSDRYINLFHDGALERCVYGFALGVVGRQLFVRWRPQAKAPARLASTATALELIAVALVVALVSAAGAGPLSLLGPPLFLLVVLLFAHQRGGVSRLLMLRPMRMLGATSYSIYMIHLFLVYRIVNALSLIQRLTPGHQLVARVDGHNQVGGGALFGDIMSVLMLALTIGAAWLSWRYVERPVQDWSRRRVLGSGARSPPPRDENVISF